MKERHGASACVSGLEVATRQRVRIDLHHTSRTHPTPLPSTQPTPHNAIYPLVIPNSSYTLRLFHVLPITHPTTPYHLPYAPTFYASSSFYPQPSLPNSTPSFYSYSSSSVGYDVPAHSCQLTGPLSKWASCARVRSYGPCQGPISPPSPATTQTATSLDIKGRRTTCTSYFLLVLLSMCSFIAEGDSTFLGE